MEKKYIQPQTCVVKLSQTHIIAESSVGINRSSNDADDSEALVKGNSTSNYNVWDDNWSK